jgi:hypothetical protein
MGLQLSGSIQLEGNLLVTGSANSVFENILVSGKLTAQEIETQFVSASIIYSSGSNKFGDEITDNQQFTGSVDISGSLGVNGIPTFGSVSGSVNTIPKFTDGYLLGDSGIFESGSNVGIGTTNPLFALDIGSVISNIRVAPSTTTNNALTRYVNAGGTGFIGLDNSTGGLTTPYALNIYHTGAYPITFSTTDAEKMRITSVGNVGIGTDSPGSKLDVNGDIYSRTGFGIYANTFSPYSGNMNIALGGSGNNLIVSGGNVGIGTASPSERLQVAGNINVGTTLPLLLSNDTVNEVNYINGIYYTTDNSGYGIAFGKIVSGTKTKQLVIRDSGNVGIGTNSPARKLEVSQTGDAFINIRGSYSNNSGIIFSDIDLNGDSCAIRNDREDNALWFSTNGINNERMRITSGGNVGIGTDSPTTKLDVNGGVKVLNGNTLTLLNPANTNGSNIRSVTEGDFRVTTGGTTDALTISNLGNIGLNGKTSITKTHADYTLTVQNVDSAGYGIFIRAGGTNPLIDGYDYNASAIFRVSGTGVIFAQNTSVQSISDVRTKENIVNSTDGLDIINSLRPVRFDFKDGFGSNKKNQLGFIAQEVEEIFPDVVDEWIDYNNNSTVYKTVGPAGLIPVLVKAIQEQQELIQSLTNRLSILETK